jgi:hypothetical protein
MLGRFWAHVHHKAQQNLNNKDPKCVCKESLAGSSWIWGPGQGWEPKAGPEKPGSAETRDFFPNVTNFLISGILQKSKGTYFFKAFCKISEFWMGKLCVCVCVWGGGGAFIFKG